MTTQAEPARRAVLEVSGVTKRFPGVVALDAVSFDVRAGEIHALVGENGAGKSTLMKILSGALEADSGVVALDGAPLPKASPAERRRLGIAMVYQELPQVPAMTVAENVLLGALPARSGGFVDAKRRDALAAASLRELGVQLPLDAPFETLGPGERQIVEIAKALALDARVLLLDEPTASLSPAEVERLFGILRRLAGQGRAIVYISHRLDEVFTLCSRVTVLRDGRVVSTESAAAADRNSIIEKMVGRGLREEFPPIDWEPGEEVLRVERLARRGRFEDVTFNLRRGEILGIAGLLGAGRTDLLLALCGAAPATSGSIRVRGDEVRLDRPRRAWRAGIGLLHEDRKQAGIVAMRSVRENATLASLRRVSSFGWLRMRDEARSAQGVVDRLAVRTPSLETAIDALSGGNQQKVLLGRVLEGGASILLIDEPTRGVDVGARSEIYARLAAAARSGASIVLVSSDLPEVLGLSHRVAVMRRGRCVGILPRREASPASVMRLAVGDS